MKLDINQEIKELAAKSNRIVITEKKAYDPKNKKSNIVLADIRENNEIDFICSKLLIDETSNEGSWMSPIDFYINFMNSKSILKSIGVVLDSWLRCTEWDGDYAINNHNEFQAWVSNNKEKYIESNA